MLHATCYMKKVLVFGVFDGLHKGHQYFLREAKKLGDYLIVAIPLDDVVKEIKKRAPLENFETRKKHLQAEDFVDEVISSDASLNNWGVLERSHPDIIVLGYDQDDLKKALENHLLRNGIEIKIKVIKSFKPRKYKSSLLNKLD